MKKLAENIVLRSSGDSRVQFIQTLNDTTFVEELVLDDIPEMYVCVNTEKFLSVFDESRSKLIPQEDCLLIKTGRSEVKLPYMKEYGVFCVQKEIHIPQGTQITEEFDIDFSSVSLETVDALDQFSYILFNRFFTCRYLYNTLTFYGTLTGDYYNITPKQFKLLKSLGRLKISIYGGFLVASCEKTLVVMRLYSSVINLKMLDRFFKNTPICELKLDMLDMKRLKLFSKESDDAVFTLSETTLKVEAPGYFEEYDVSYSLFQEEMSLRIFSKDFEHLSGDISVYFMSGSKYLITHPQNNKTVLFLCS